MGEGGKWELLSKLIDSLPVLLIVLGVSLIVLGLAKGVTYHDWLPIRELGARLLAGAVGVVILVVGVQIGIDKSGVRPLSPQSQDYAITIESPKDGDEVDVVDVRGTIGRPLPDGYVLRMFKIFPASNTFAPIGVARIDIAKKRWEAERCDIGGRPGERRSVAAYVVGPDGIVLLDYYASAVRRHRISMDKLKAATGNAGDYLPPFERGTSDMVECARVSLRRTATASTV